MPTDRVKLSIDTLRGYLHVGQDGYAAIDVLAARIRELELERTHRRLAGDVMRGALQAIVSHQETVAGDLAVMSITRRIAKAGLDEAAELESLTED